MTRSELDKVITHVGGMVHLIDMLTQITRAQHCPLVRASADRPTGPDAIYDFFADGPLTIQKPHHPRVDAAPLKRPF